MRNASPQRLLSLIVFCLWLCLAGAARFEIGAPVAARGADNCIDCHRRQKDPSGQVVATFQTSTHSRASVG